MIISKALPEDHSALTNITIQSKAHWGYTKAQMDLWTEDLTISADYIDKNEVFKLILDDKIVAYYSFYQNEESEVVLDNLFISPRFIGKGIGRKLLVDFIIRLKQSNFTTVLLYSDPHAEEFYRHFEFETVGQKETSIEGRFLPIMIRILK